nr:FHA domain-containing protein [Leucobacter edaphi]
MLILRIGFLLLLWFFIFTIVYALRSDLFGAPVRRLKSENGRSSGSGSASPVVAAAAPVSAPPVAAAAPAPSAPSAPTEAVQSAGGRPADSGPAITPSAGLLPSAGPEPTASGAAPAAGTPGHGAAGTLVITSGVATGTAIPLDEDFVSIGRSGDSTLVIVDEYTSTYHARLARQGDQWILTDLDSTNGTRLNGERVKRPVVVPLNTPVTIGTTTFELRP